MAKYRRITDVLEAEQWRFPGDLTGDRPLVRGEGRIVKNYKRDGVPDTLPCSLCSQPMHAHGWISATEMPVNATVEPVSGALVAPVAPVFPKTYAKDGAPDRHVQDADEESLAVADGFHIVAAASTTVPVVADRGDGIAVCPGDWVITHHDGEREAVKPIQFDKLYAKVTTMVAG